jgi:hypothetical protein
VEITASKGFYPEISKLNLQRTHQTDKGSAVQDRRESGDTWRHMAYMVHTCIIYTCVHQIPFLEADKDRGEEVVRVPVG